MIRSKAYRVRMDGGDGVCPFFACIQILERAEESWFPGRLGEWGGALLFRVIEGSHCGDYIAMTRAENDGFLLREGYFPGVAHHILRPGPEFVVADADPCGKSVVYLIRDE